MPDKLILTTVSATEVIFKPGGEPACFDVNVINNSPGFASFLVELIAAGADFETTESWYDIYPGVSSKKPPGEGTNFHITITDTPLPGFFGLINLTVRVFSMEMAEETRITVRLMVEEGSRKPPLKLSLPIAEFNVYPGDEIELPVVVHNPGHLATTVTLTCVGLDPAWLVSGLDQTLQIAARKQQQTRFVCQPRVSNKSVSKIYDFTIKATQNNGPYSEVKGKLEVLPIGFVEMICHPIKQYLPNKKSWYFWRSEPVSYDIKLNNSSNLRQSVSVEIQGDAEYKCSLELEPNTAELEPEETGELLLKAQKKRPWIGREQKLLLQVQTLWSDRRVETRNSTQSLQLRVKPILPNWFVALTTMGLLYLVWWCSWLNPDNPYFGHQDAVNSVQFNGSGLLVISGSNDKTSRLWETNGFFVAWINQAIGIIATANKAVRVVHYKPVDNDQIAEGLENGAINLWDILGPDSQFDQSFFYQKDDRVMGLEFSSDSHYLFSGHGSGLVLQWNLLDNSPLPPLDKRAIIRRKNIEANQPDVSSKQPLRKKQLGFAVYALKLVGKNDDYLAIGGRYNQLAIWNWVTDKVQSISYPRQGSQNDYIFSIDHARFKPNLMVTSDNQGYISLWDMSKCLQDAKDCKPIDEWSSGHGGQPVRSVSLSSNGCYVASGGDDGRVLLWYLTADGRRATPTSTEVVKSYNAKKINSTDIRLTKQYVFIASGSDDTQVRVNKSDRTLQWGCDH